MQQPRESQSALNSKINSIEQYLSAVEHDLSTLALEQQLWQQQRQDWQAAATRQIDSTQAHLREELSGIEREIRRRDERCREAVEKIGVRMRAIDDVQRHCGVLVMQLGRRVMAVEELLGGH